MCHTFYRVISHKVARRILQSRQFGNEFCRGDGDRTRIIRRCVRRVQMYLCTSYVIRAHYVYTYAHAVCGSTWVSRRVSEHGGEEVSHMGASVPCNTSPTDGGDIRAADVQMKLTDWLRLNRLHILLRLRRTTSGEPGERPRTGGFARHQINSSIDARTRIALLKYPQVFAVWKENVLWSLFAGLSYSVVHFSNLLKRACQGFISSVIYFNYENRLESRQILFTSWTQYYLYQIVKSHF